MIRVKRASHGANPSSVKLMAEAEVTADMVRFRFHRMIARAVDEHAPSHLNKKGRMAWASQELGLGFDRVRKAYHRAVRCIEHHEFTSLADRYAVLLKKQEQQLARRLEQHRITLDQWQRDRAARCRDASAAD